VILMLIALARGGQVLTLFATDGELAVFLYGSKTAVCAGEPVLEPLKSRVMALVLRALAAPAYLPHMVGSSKTAVCAKYHPLCCQVRQPFSAAPSVCPDGTGPACGHQAGRWSPFYQIDEHTSPTWKEEK
jgi:hypothetical protein